MAFAQFTSIEQIAARYGIEYGREAFLRPVAGATLSPTLREELDYSLRMVPFQRSEMLAREAVIYPILRDVAKHYSDHLTLFSGEPVNADADLRGEVDYVVCRRSPLGPLMPDRPYLMVGEAKRDDSSGGWAQAFGGMLAARILNDDTRLTYYGLTTTAQSWRFGRLTGNRFVQDPRVFGITDDLLAGALHFVFSACRDQLLQPPAAA